MNLVIAVVVSVCSLHNVSMAEDSSSGNSLVSCKLLMMEAVADAVASELWPISGNCCSLTVEEREDEVFREFSWDNRACCCCCC